MAIDAAKAKELIESVFSYDKVGADMNAVRKAPESKDALKRLSEALASKAAALAGDDSPGARDIIAKVAKERAQQYADGVKASKSGCGGLK